jgi:hypothetical protein
MLLVGHNGSEVEKDNESCRSAIERHDAVSPRILATDAYMSSTALRVFDIPLIDGSLMILEGATMAVRVDRTMIGSRRVNGNDCG